MWRLALIFVASFLIVQPCITQSCTPNATQQAAAATIKLRKTLVSATIEDFTYDVPLRLQPVLQQFKQALIETVDTALRCNNPEPAQLQSDFAALLGANRPMKPEPPYDGRITNHSDIFGSGLIVTVKPVPGQLGLYSIQMDYGIECGDDNILLLYRRSAEGYRRELLIQSPEIKQASDAFGDGFLYQIVPVKASRSYVIAVVRGFPWCTSNWSAFNVDLLAPAQGNGAQSVIAHLKQQYRRDDGLSLRPTPGGFELRGETFDLAGGVLTRPGVFRYRTTAGTLERIQPIALNARDFVDEWLQIPWADAAKWSYGSLKNLKAVHDSFDYRLHPNDRNGMDTYGPTRACTQSNIFQVELNTSTDLFARVHQGNNSFTMLSMSPTPDPACKGPNLMKD